MEEIKACMRRRTKLLYDINCIKHYIEGGDYDASLKQAWSRYNKELEEINTRIAEYAEPNYDKLCEEKKSLESAIKTHKDEIKKLREEVSYINDLISKTVC